MDVQAILTELRDQRDRIDAAIAALEQTTHGTGKRRGRKPGQWHMSAEARARISAAQKKRWAAQKKATKTA